MAIRDFRAAAAGTVLLGAGAGYGAGVVGPPVHAISDEFDVSLTAVGLLTSAFFAGIVALNVTAPAVERSVGVRGSLRLCSLLMSAGMLACAVAPWFWLLVAGRVVAGLGVGLALVMGGLVGRAAGGATLVGVYGAALTIAVAAALAVGGVLGEAGVSWRANFFLAAAVALSSLPFFGRALPELPRPRRGLGSDLLRTVTTWPYWRSGLLFVLAAGVPLAVTAWIVPYLSSDDALGTGAAGAMGFLLFAASTAGRAGGGRIDSARGRALLVASPFVTALGFAVLALDTDPAVSVPAVVVLGLAFSIPYAVSYVRAEDLVPGKPAVGLSAELLAVNMTPIVAAPAIGAAFDAGHAGAAWLALGAFSVLAGVANLPHPAPRSVRIGA